MKAHCLIYLFSFVVFNLTAQEKELSVNEIRLAIEALQNGLKRDLVSESIYCRTSVPKFYYEKGFQAVWDEYLKSELISAIEDCENEGLFPEDYHLDQLKALSAMPALSVSEKRDFELLLTDAFLLLSSHLISGKVDPQKIDSQWKVIRREGDPVMVLNAALVSRDIRGTLEDLKPTFKGYRRLKERLLTYRKIYQDGGWEPIADGPTLKLNMESDRVLSLRRRLRSSGDLLSYTVEDLRLYDEAVAGGVKRFQRRNGLFPDGHVGKETLALLNVPVEKRIQQVVINIERCRWLPQDLGANYIMVNLPAFELEVVREAKVEMEMIVAVGKPYRQTPVFSSKMTYLVFNPYWTIPPTILSQDVIPAQAKNPKYLDNLNIKILDREGKIISPSEINWASVNPKTFRYTLRQEPGPNNALGEVKFIFPNQYNVYMHDTNHRELFVKTERALSSGCIRLSKPMDMANYILAEDQNWNKDRTNGVLRSRQNYTVVLKQPLQVYLQYWTAYVDEHGVLNFRKDIYSRDDKVFNALREDASKI